MRYRFVAAAPGVLAALGVAWALDLDSATPAQRCAALKIQAVAASAAAQVDCYKKVGANPTPVVDPVCLEKARRKLRDAFAEAEALGGCVTVGDANATNTRVVDVFGVQVAPLLPPSGSPTCDCGPTPPVLLAVTPEAPSGVCGTATGDVSSLDLTCGAAYVGGGAASQVTLSFPYGSALLTKYYEVASCTNSRLQLAATTAAEVGSRHCTDVGCLVGPPFDSPVATVCTVLSFRLAPSGTADCQTGEINIALPIQSDIYSGVCPECIGGTCTGGANAGGACVVDGPPDTHSVDCQPSPADSIATAYLFDEVVTSGAQSRDAAPTGSQTNVFCGFCGDATPTFEDPPRPCALDTDCAASPYTSCRQYTEGFFGDPTISAISMTGTPAGDLTDGLSHLGTWVTVFCVSPTANAGVNVTADIPGPVALSTFNSYQLIVTTTTSSTTTTTTSSTTTTT